MVPMLPCWGVPRGIAVHGLRLVLDAEQDLSQPLHALDAQEDSRHEAFGIGNLQEELAPAASEHPLGPATKQELVVGPERGQGV